MCRREVGSCRERLQRCSRQPRWLHGRVVPVGNAHGARENRIVRLFASRLQPQQVRLSRKIEVCDRTTSCRPTLNSFRSWPPRKRGQLRVLLRSGWWKSNQKKRSDRAVEK